MTNVASILIAASALGGCLSDDDGEYPIEPHSSPPVTTESTPGGSPDTVTGRVCRATDLRDLTTCAAGAAGGLNVSLGGSRTITNPDGSFTLDAPRGSNLAFSVEGPGVVPTTTPFSASRTIQVIDADLFARMLTSNGVLITDNTGSILTTVIDDGGLPLAGVSASAIPASLFGPFYDGTDPVTWGVNSTGTRGVIWQPGLTAGMVDLTYEHIAGGLTTTVNGVPVRNGGVTVLDTNVPGILF